MLYSHGAGTGPGKDRLYTLQDVFVTDTTDNQRCARHLSSKLLGHNLNTDIIRQKLERVSNLPSKGWLNG